MLIVLYSRDNGTIMDVRAFGSEEEFQEWIPRQLKLHPDTKILKKAKSWEEIES